MIKEYVSPLFEELSLEDVLFSSNSGKENIGDGSSIEGNNSEDTFKNDF